jgi:hypothetical protein
MGVRGSTRSLDDCACMLSDIDSKLDRLNQQSTQFQILSYVAIAIAGIAIIVSFIRKKI